MRSLKEWWKRILPREKQTQIAINVVSTLLPLLHRTWRITEENRDGVEQSIIENSGIIMVTWHGRALVPFMIMINRGCYALVSKSNDGEVLAGILKRLGWGLIRGSSGRGAVAALKSARDVLSKPGTMLAFTPDGPRGPCGVAKPGMIFLARKTGKPLFPVGIAASPRILFGSWDRFMLPLPFARCHFIYGEPVVIGEEEDLDSATLRVQIAISAVEARAERFLGNTPLSVFYRPTTAEALTQEDENTVTEGNPVALKIAD